MFVPFGRPDEINKWEHFLLRSRILAKFAFDFSIIISISLELLLTKKIIGI